WVLLGLLGQVKSLFFRNQPREARCSQLLPLVFQRRLIVLRQPNLKANHHPSAGWQLSQLARNLFRALRSNNVAASRAMNDTDASKEQPKIVVRLRRRSNCRPRRTGRVMSIDRNRRWQPADPLGLRLFQALQKLPRVGGKTLDVPPLPFGIKRVEGQA